MDVRVATTTESGDLAIDTKGIDECVIEMSQNARHDT